MPKVIIITNVDLEGYYNYTMEYLDAKYHQFPDQFQDFEISEEAAGQISSLNNMASHIDAPTSPDGRYVWNGEGWIPTGKAAF